MLGFEARRDPFPDTVTGALTFPSEDAPILQDNMRNELAIGLQ